MQGFVVPFFGAELFYIWIRSLGAKIGNKVVINAHPLVTSYHHPEYLIIKNGARARLSRNVLLFRQIPIMEFTGG